MTGISFFISFDFTVMMVVPFAFAETTPAELTVAIFSSADFHSKENPSAFAGSGFAVTFVD